MRVQSCAIALRSPASERPSDLNRYSPDIHHQVRGAAQRHPAYPLILRLDGVPRHARLLACFHSTRKPSLAPSTTIPARGSPAPPSPSATLELAAAAKEHISGLWCQSRWCLAVPYTNSHMPYITRSALAVSKDTNSPDLLSTFGATELGSHTLGSPPAAARNTLDLAPTEPQPFLCRCAYPCTSPTHAATPAKSITR